MSVTVQDLMSENVVSARPEDTVGHLKRKMLEHGVKTIPVVSELNVPVGVISAADLMAVDNEAMAASAVMTEKVFTIPEYEHVEVAARIMRNHKIRHLVVTKDQAVIGIISAFDLLKLVEGRRFEAKSPAPKGKSRGQRSKAEL